MQRAISKYFLAGLVLTGLVSGCVLKDPDKDDPSGICIHSTTTSTYPSANCTGTPTQAIYTYCTEESKEANCLNKTATCTSNVTYDDTNIFYKGKKCDSSGYTVTCANNSANKVSDAVYCPP